MAKRSFLPVFKAGFLHFWQNSDFRCFTDKTVICGVLPVFTLFCTPHPPPVRACVYASSVKTRVLVVLPDLVVLPGSRVWALQGTYVISWFFMFFTRKSGPEKGPKNVTFLINFQSFPDWIALAQTSISGENHWISWFSGVKTDKTGDFLCIGMRQLAVFNRNGL